MLADPEERGSSVWRSLFNEEQVLPFFSLFGEPINVRTKDRQFFIFKDVLYCSRKLEHRFDQESTPEVSQNGDLAFEPGGPIPSHSAQAQAHGDLLRLPGSLHLVASAAVPAGESWVAQPRRFFFLPVSRLSFFSGRVQVPAKSAPIHGKRHKRA